MATPLTFNAALKLPIGSKIKHRYTANCMATTVAQAASRTLPGGKFVWSIDITGVETTTSRLVEGKVVYSISGLNRHLWEIV